MNSEVPTQNAKVIFISLVSFAIVVLIVVSYFVFFTKEKEDTETVNTTITNSNTNTNNIVSGPSNSSNIDNLLAQPMERKVPHTGPLENIADGTYKDFSGKQVFNISNQIFSYDDAKAICKAHGAELATQEQVQEAYDKGAEWCAHGWTQNQISSFPMQPATIATLAEDPDTSGICGEMGINGGYYDNPNTLFGANCYGVKPEPKNRERAKPIPVSQKAQNILHKVSKYKSELNEFTVKPFNDSNWSEEVSSN